MRQYYHRSLRYSHTYISLICSLSLSLFFLSFLPFYNYSSSSSSNNNILHLYAAAATAAAARSDDDACDGVSVSDVGETMRTPFCRRLRSLLLLFMLWLIKFLLLLESVGCSPNIFPDCRLYCKDHITVSLKITILEKKKKKQFWHYDNYNNCYLQLQ